MTEKERQYLSKRLNELFQKKLQLNLEMRKLDKEIQNIYKKLGEEIETQ